MPSRPPAQTVRLHEDMPVLRHPRVWAEIDRAALAANYRALADPVTQVSPHTRPMAVVKADAYGHGIQPVLLTLLEEGCRLFAAACVEEAIAVRRVLRTVLTDAEADVLILGYASAADAPLLAEYALTATLISMDYARALSAEAARLGLTVSCHVALDTGMNRIGLPCCSESDIAQATADIRTMEALPGLSVDGMFTHFARADEAFSDVMDEGGHTVRQYDRYRAVLARLEAEGHRPRVCHVCNTAAAVRFPSVMPDACLDAVRLGIGLYGYGADFGDGEVPAARATAVRPVMRLMTTVVHLHTLLPGETVGYGGEFSADTPRTIATLPVGYADGWIRALAGAEVTVNTARGDIKAPLVGRICMDQCMLDVTDLPVTVGDAVTLFGDTPASLEALCARAHTIPYELLCLVTARVPRVVR